MLSRWLSSDPIARQHRSRVTSSQGHGVHGGCHVVLTWHTSRPVVLQGLAPVDHLICPAHTARPPLPSLATDGRTWDRTSSAQQQFQLRTVKPVSRKPTRGELVHSRQLAYNGTCEGEEKDELIKEYDALGP